MNIALWIIQGLVGAAFIFAGLMKATQDRKKLEPQMAWVGRFDQSTVRLIGVLEVLGGLGMILPWATGILPILTPVAAVGLTAIMVLAAVHHLRHKEYQGIVFNAILAALAITVAIGRF